MMYSGEYDRGDLIRIPANTTLFEAVPPGELQDHRWETTEPILGVVVEELLPAIPGFIRVYTEGRKWYMNDKYVARA
jgi:hypothetical protein